jgi:mannose-6-phosphate isomerase-like protein (cupin superfamily)
MGRGPTSADMSTISIEAVREDAARAGKRYLEFLRVPAMSAGGYFLDRGQVDRQSPHGEDEIYYVVRGRGKFRNGDADRPIGPGDVLFVPAHQEHRFHDVEEDLVLLVVFSPAEHVPE